MNILHWLFLFNIENINSNNYFIFIIIIVIDICFIVIDK